MDVQESKQIQAMQETEKLGMIKQSVFPPTKLQFAPTCSITGMLNMQLKLKYILVRLILC